MPTFFHFTHTSLPFRIAHCKDTIAESHAMGNSPKYCGRKLKLYPYQQHIIYLLCSPHMLSELLRE